MHTHIYAHTPFSPSTIREKNHPALLLLLILKEALKKDSAATTRPAPTVFPPYDWNVKSSSSQKIEEYLSLLPVAFPEFARLISSLQSHLDAPASIFATLLEPLILACKSNENVLLFLVLHQKELAIKSLLDKICPAGVDVLKENIAARFRNRGYHFTRWISSKTP